MLSQAKKTTYQLKIYWVFPETNHLSFVQKQLKKRGPSFPQWSSMRSFFLLKSSQQEPISYRRGNLVARKNSHRIIADCFPWLLVFLSNQVKGQLSLYVHFLFFFYAIIFFCLLDVSVCATVIKTCPPQLNFSGIDFESIG